MTEPEGAPVSSGKRTTKVLPSSSTVTVKSVPRIPIVAELVLILIFSFGILPVLLVTNLAVPFAKVSARVDFVGLGS